jgi:rhodanese-related sulfurtransferase
VVVGGGYIGLEMAEALRNREVAVTLVELAPQVFAAADPEMVAPIHRQLKLHGVDLRLGTSVTAIREEAGRLSVQLSTGESVECGLVIMAVGVRPEAKLAKEAGLAIGEIGGIVVDEHMRTSDPHIWAVGDAVEVPHLVGGAPAVIPLAGPANRQGRVAADSIFGRPSVYRSSQGTAICKVFDLAIGMTGMSEKALRRSGRAYEKIYVHPASHAGYYPGASQLSLKLLFDPKTGAILGAQAVGADGVDKRIDVLAVALRAGLTVDDLKDMELSYAPPYGSAKDPINYAGFVASNVISGDMPVCHAEDMAAPRDNQMLLDVRTPAEVKAGTIPGARNIPVDDLRGRLGELPRDKEILAFCGVGLRGYLACRILSQHGLRCRNLTGGYKTYQAAIRTLPKRA